MHKNNWDTNTNLGTKKTMQKKNLVRKKMWYENFGYEKMWVRKFWLRTNNAITKLGNSLEKVDVLTTKQAWILIMSKQFGMLTT